MGTNGILNSFSTEDLSGRLETDTATSNYVFAADAPLPDVAPWANASDFHLEFALYNQVFLWLGQKLAFNFTNQSSDEQFEDFLVFLQNTNTSGIIQNIAASITDRIRHNYDDVFAEGSSLRPVVYVAVEWPWIILPVGAVLLSTIVLGMTVWTNHRHNAPLWKSGLMPLFFHGLDGWDSDELRVENRQEMDKRAKEMHARLQRRDDGDIRFVRMERSHSI
ncbi:hypothetical protein SLS56_002871 [Neofusicoccum ribis]|uniref:Uncharacterized protein n=1 Tax=Neofusicoccum ribis TaxID=45134 RepID=A0ABR3T1Q2_9PEZI